MSNIIISTSAGPPISGSQPLESMRLPYFISFDKTLTFAVLVIYLAKLNFDESGHYISSAHSGFVQ